MPFHHQSRHFDITIPARPQTLYFISFTNHHPLALLRCESLTITTSHGPCSITWGGVSNTVHQAPSCSRDELCPLSWKGTLISSVFFFPQPDPKVTPLAHHVFREYNQWHAFWTDKCTAAPQHAVYGIDVAQVLIRINLIPGLILRRWDTVYKGLSLILLHNRS